MIQLCCILFGFLINTKHFFYHSKCDIHVYGSINLHSTFLAIRGVSRDFRTIHLCANGIHLCIVHTLDFILTRIVQRLFKFCRFSFVIFKNYLPMILPIKLLYNIHYTYSECYTAPRSGHLTLHLMALMKVPRSVGSRHLWHWHRKYLVRSRCFRRTDQPHLPEIIGSTKVKVYFVPGRFEE